MYRPELHEVRDPNMPGTNHWMEAGIPKLDFRRTRFRSLEHPSFSKWMNKILCLWNARGHHDRKCEARLKMQMFGFVNRGSKMDLTEICDDLPWRPSTFGRSRLPKARQYNLNVGFVHRNFSKFEIFHGTLRFGRGRPPPVRFFQPITPVARLNLLPEKVSDSSNFFWNSLFSNSVLLCSSFWAVEWIHKSPTFSFYKPWKEKPPKRPGAATWAVKISM